MKKQQDSELNMCYSVKTACDKFQSTWATNTVFAASYNVFSGKITLVEQNRDAQMLTATGITVDKTTKRNLMTDKALFISNRMQSYAAVVGNSDLLASIRYNLSDMRRARDTSVAGICDNILAKANANVTALAAYGITAALITDLQTAITNYSAALSKPRMAISQSKNATENLVVLFKEINEVLTKRLDLDIEMFKTSKPDFYSQYKTARKVISTANTISSVLGKVTKKDNGIALPGVTFSFKLLNNSLAKAATTPNNSEITKKSASKGQFRILNMPQGTYTVTVTKLGYKQQTVTIDILNGETTNLQVELEKA
jgi:hypothetical protein